VRQLGLSDDLNFVVLVVIFLPLIVAASYGFHCLFERPFMRLKPKPVKAPGLAPAVQDIRGGS
jgi:peptidoglycan/LPS O-acetylase OafA/YrhL